MSGVWLCKTEEGHRVLGGEGCHARQQLSHSEPCLPGGARRQGRGFEPASVQKPLREGRWLHRETLEKQFPAGFVENLWFDPDLEVSVKWATLYPFGSNRPLAGASDLVGTAGDSFPPGCPWSFPRTAVGSEEFLPRVFSEPRTWGQGLAHSRCLLSV